MKFILIALALLFVFINAKPFATEDVSVKGFGITNDVAQNIEMSFEDGSLQPEFVLTSTGPKVPSLNPFNSTRSAQLVRYAGIAYCQLENGKKKLLDWSCKACKQVPKVINIRLFHDAPKKTGKMSDRLATDANGYIGYVPSSNTIILSFAGTEISNPLNLVDDVAAVFDTYKYCKKCKVHYGFYRSWNRVKIAVRKHIDELRRLYNNPSITITGHSLGGAIAIHAIAELYQLGYKIALPTSTFGSPRIGNAAFAKWFNGIFSNRGVYRVVHNKDPVPHVPLHKWGYVHPTQEIHYNSANTKYTICSATNGEDPNCSFKIGMTSLFFIKDHSNYHSFSFTKANLGCAAN